MLPGFASAQPLPEPEERSPNASDRTSYLYKMNDTVGVAAGNGVVEYMKCLNPPEGGAGHAQPCREGGSVFRIARDPIFNIGSQGPQCDLKRVVLFYTPRGVWGPIDAPDNAGFEAPTVGTLIQSFDDAMLSCRSLITRLSRGHDLDLNTYGRCIDRFFELNVYQLHTALRGVAVVLEVVSERPYYSMPGRCRPQGYITEVEVDLPPEARGRFRGEVKLWIIANGPVVVPPLDLQWQEG